MEDRSSRRMRTLVTQMARRGLSVNEVARALISMMARSTTRSNQRPDTLMQDRICQVDETSCNARPDHTFGSKGDIGGRLDEVCFTPMNGHRQTAPACPFGARKRHWNAIRTGLFIAAHTQKHWRRWVDNHPSLCSRFVHAPSRRRRYVRPGTLS